MSSPVITAESLGKHYWLGGRRQVRASATDDGPSSRRGWLKNPFARSTVRDGLWALRDVSFDVGAGEVVGFVGVNGAGKSTLLKLLSRITDPTEGKARIVGRVGTLLEVGTGFHPELTGRENIFLSGAILGMHRAEIRRKFDAIVNFSEVERFLDTPVKRYSSGMYVRLAFAVAAHLDPEILLVDEVLAVGDASFQRKCLGAMSDVSKQGRTVLFVSHNMIAVQNLCRRVIWLEGGRLMKDGPSAEIIGAYLRATASSETVRSWRDPETAPGNERVRLDRVCVRPLEGTPQDPIGTSTPLAIEVDFTNLVPDARLHICLHLLNEQQIIAFTSGSHESDDATRDKPLPAGRFQSVCHVPGDLLNDGVHRVAVRVLLNGVRTILYHESAVTFEVRELEARPGAWYGKEPGVVRPKLRWATRAFDTEDVATR